MIMISKPATADLFTAFECKDNHFSLNYNYNDMFYYQF